MGKSIRDRIIDGLDASGMSGAELARKAGVSYDVIAKLRHRPTSSTSAENAERLLAALGAPPERVENGAPAPTGARLVPVYDIQASAGDGAMVGYESVAYSLAFPPDYLRRITRSDPGNLTIISVKGDSMEPTLGDDDIVMLDMSKTSLGYEGLFVIRIYDVLHVKRLSHSRPGHVLVISDNRDKYPPCEYPVSEVEVVGKVLWAGGKV
jgi:phage repressor protein C with HTH and peptisase S24 domain